MKKYSSVEVLESRIAPAAGVVTVLVSGTNMTVTGDNVDNDVRVTETGGGGFTITGNNGTLVKLGDGVEGGQVDVTGILGNVTINLKEGSDLLQVGSNSGGAVFGENLTILMGNGDNAVDLSDLDVAGNFSLNGGKGTDTVTTDGDLNEVGGKMSVFLGEGTNSLVFGTDTVVSGAFLYKGGHGEDSVTTDTFNDATFGSSFTFLGGKGVNVLDIDVSGSLNIAGKVHVMNGNHNNGMSVVAFQAIDEGIFGGDILIKNGAGDFDVLISGGAVTDVAGNVTIHNGHGSSESEILGQDIDIDGSVMMKNGKGEFTNRIYGGATAEILGNLRIINGNGDADNFILADDFSISGNVFIKNGGHNSGESNTTFPVNNLFVGGLLHILNGAGTSSVVFDNFNGTDPIVGTFGKSVMIHGGRGDDTVSMLIDDLDVTGNVSFNMGNGSNEVTVEATDALAVTGNVSYKGGINDDTFTLTNGGGTIGGRLSAIVGKGSADIEVSDGLLNVLNGVMVNSTGKQNESAQVILDGITTNTISVKTGNGADFVRGSNISVSSLAFLSTSGGADSIQVDNFTGVAKVTVLAGSDGDILSLETNPGFAGSSTFNGVVSLDMGSGDDTVTVGVNGSGDTLAIFNGTLKSNGGSGTDTLNDLNGQYNGPVVVTNYP